MTTAVISSLPPGFRFHPTDEELIHYLKDKVSSSLSPNASINIAEIDLYKLNPWELPEEAYVGDDEWFCFSPREKKYPNGVRPNRTAASGYWKATGPDKPILSSHASQYLGVKKALIFYMGRPPKGTKTSWIMHEYRLPSNSHLPAQKKGSMKLDDWVLCRIRHKGIIRALKEEPGANSSGHEEAVVQKWEHNFESCKFSCEVLDGKGQKEILTDGMISDGDSDCKEKRKRCLKDALEGIKRVLSLGALDEQVTEWPNKGSSSVTM